MIEWVAKPLIIAIYVHSYTITIYTYKVTLLHKTL